MYQNLILISSILPPSITLEINLSILEMILVYIKYLVS